MAAGHPGSALPDNPLSFGPKARTLPPNPVAGRITGTVMTGRPGHQYPAGAAQQLQAETAKASAPAIASYNRRSGGTQGIVPGFSASDLKSVRASAKANPQVAANIGSITDPFGTAIQGAEQLGRGVREAVSGRLGRGALDLGLGGLSAASVLPFGRGTGALLGETVGRTAEEAAQHVAEASTAARGSGFGIRRSQEIIPKLKPGETTPETGGELGAQVRSALKNAPEARAEQKTLMSAERARRSAKLQSAFDQGGMAGHIAAMATLKGELPHVDFGGFKQFDQQALEGMLTHIGSHPTMRPLQKAAAQRTLLRAVDGRVPTRSGQTLLEQAFGREAGQQIAASVPFWQRAKRLGLDVLNVPRSIMASTDLSAPFRQGLVAGAAYPKTFFKNFNTMIRSFGSENVFQGVMHGIYDRPTYPLMQKARLALTDIGTEAGGAQELSQREEQFVSNLAERIPGIGHVVRASDRAYVGFLNKTRADIFDQLVQQAAESGHNLNDEKTITDIARFVNSATGRGDLRALNAHTATMNALFFSPRLLYSRLNFLNPVWYVRMDPFARQQALKAAFRLVGTLGTVLALAKYAGAKVNTDPTNADFGKIRIGNTRLDVAGGFTQPIRLISQLALGRVTSSTTGKILTLGPQGPGKLSRADIALRFVQGKLAPMPSAIWETAQQKQFGGQKFSWSQEAQSRFLPLLEQDIQSLYQTQGGLPAQHRNLFAAGMGALDLFGVGVNSYAPKQPKSKSTNPWAGNSSGSSGSPWGSTQTKGSNPWGP